LVPNDIQALGYRSQAHTKLKEYQQALAASNYLVELDPHFPWSYHIRGRTYLAFKEYQQAIENFDRTLELDPKYSWAYDGRGLAYLWLKDTKHAKSNYAAYWDLDAALTQTRVWPQNAALIRTRGWPRINSGWLVEWVSMCEKPPDPGTAERLEAIATTDPEHYVAFVCRGVAMWLRASYQEAMEELEKANQLAREEAEHLLTTHLTKHNGGNRVAKGVSVAASVSTFAKPRTTT